VIVRKANRNWKWRHETRPKKRKATRCKTRKAISQLSQYRDSQHSPHLVNSARRAGPAFFIVYRECNMTLFCTRYGAEGCGSQCLPHKCRQMGLCPLQRTRQKNFGCHMHAWSFKGADDLSPGPRDFRPNRTKLSFFPRPDGCLTGLTRLPKATLAPSTLAQLVQILGVVDRRAARTTNGLPVKWGSVSRLALGFELITDWHGLAQQIMDAAWERRLRCKKSLSTPIAHRIRQSSSLTKTGTMNDGNRPVFWLRPQGEFFG